jgi:hypothetical protein
VVLGVFLQVSEGPGLSDPLRDLRAPGDSLGQPLFELAFFFFGDEIHARFLVIAVTDGNSVAPRHRAGPRRRGGGHAPTAPPVRSFRLRRIVTPATTHSTTQPPAIQALAVASGAGETGDRSLHSSQIARGGETAIDHAESPSHENISEPPSAVTTQSTMHTVRPVAPSRRPTKTHSPAPINETVNTRSTNGARSDSRKSIHIRAAST